MLVAAILGGGGTASGALLDQTASQRPISVRGAEPAAADDLEEILEILRIFMIILGANPESLPPDPNAGMEAVVAHYCHVGPPQGLNAEEKAATRSLIRDAHATVLRCAPFLDPFAVNTFIDMLRSFYVELGGEPADLPGWGLRATQNIS